jgi:hypothetical protein
MANLKKQVPLRNKNNDFWGNLISMAGKIDRSSK